LLAGGRSDDWNVSGIDLTQFARLQQAIKTREGSLKGPPLRIEEQGSQAELQHDSPADQPPIDPPAMRAHQPSYTDHGEQANQTD
jgi:hypothetical protein